MARLSTILSEIKVITSDLRSPQAKSRRLAQFAAEEIAKVRVANRAVTGRDGPYEVAVDGKAGAPLASVRPDGVIVANFELLSGVLEWIGSELLRESPVLTGQYARSHRLFLDGVEHDPSAPLSTDFASAVFVNLMPYARKIERGLSGQAPDGVYQGLAAVASKRFGNIARIRFSYQTLEPSRRGSSRAEKQAAQDSRQPAIVVRPF